MTFASMSNTRSRSIMVVEDDAAVRRLIVRHLQQAGFAVSEAEDARQALSHARTHDAFDLVLTDVHMPGISGIELARLLLARAPLKPVVVITGDSDERLAREALSQGAAGYLLKPFELFELDAIVDQALSRLALVEATQLAARSSAATQAPDIATLPAAWLQLADDRSGAGSGHGYRVERIVGAVVQNLPDELPSAAWNALELAARAHELGRVLGPVPNEIELCARSGQLLADMLLPPEVVKTVRHLREQWDGSGGPDRLAGPDIPLTARVLAAADAVDHHAVMQSSLGMSPEQAADSAVDHVAAHSGTLFDPQVARAVGETRETIRAIWTLAAAWLSD